MKNLLFIAAIALLFSSCSGNAGDKNGKKNTENTISFSNDMENASAKIPLWVNENTVGEGEAHSGKYSCMLDKSREYSYSFVANFKNISSKLPKKVLIKAWIYSTVENPDISFVVGIDSAQKQIYWNSAVLKKDVPTANEWSEVNYGFDLTTKGPIEANDKITILLWNLNKLKVYYDDVTITFEY